MGKDANEALETQKKATGLKVYTDGSRINGKTESAASHSRWTQKKNHSGTRIRGKCVSQGTVGGADGTRNGLTGSNERKLDRIMHFHRQQGSNSLYALPQMPVRSVQLTQDRDRHRPT